jgi:hypothetical protein
VGADQHITDPDDRADLGARAYELMSEYGSLRKVREHLAADPVTVRVCGGPRHFSIDTLRTWIGEARTAEAYVELLNLAEQRVDSNTRLSLLAATMWEHLRLRMDGTGQTSLSTPELIAALDFMRKVERDRMDLLGLKAPIKVQQVDGNTPEVPPDMVAAVAAVRRRAELRARSLVDDQYPGAEVVPVRHPPRSPRRGTRRVEPPEERSS